MAPDFFVEIIDAFHRRTLSQNAISTFHNSINRILAVIEAMDNGETLTKQVSFWKDRVKARTGDLPKGQKWYLLNKLFRLRPSEISELEVLDKKNSSVRQLIIKTSDQIQAGELSLNEVTPAEKKAAKARLDTHRKKRRKRHAKKRNSPYKPNSQNLSIILNK